MAWDNRPQYGDYEAMISSNHKSKRKQQHADGVKGDAENGLARTHEHNMQLRF